MVGWSGRPIGSALRRRDVLLDIRRPPLRETHADQFQRSRDAGEQIVEVVRQAPGELANGLHLLALAKLLVRGLQRRGTFVDAFFQRLGDRAQGPLGHLYLGRVLYHADITLADGSW